MLQLRNNTPLECEVVPLADCDGVDTVYTFLKGTFTISDRLRFADVPVPVCLADEHYGEPATSSIRTSSDLCLEKHGTDVLLVGSAWAPGGEPTWQMDVSLTVGAITKRARVFGDRVWRAGASGVTMEWIAPFVRMPLVWERAFGGADVTERGPIADARNPVGRGFRAPAGAARTEWTLPNVEDQRRLITEPKATPLPTGFAPIAPHWEPRKSYAGTYDDAWRTNRAPFLPTDFDVRFFHVATPELIVTNALQGGEVVTLQGMTPEGTLQFALPRANVEVSHRLDTGVETRPAHLDTVLLEPDASRVVMTWRSALRCDKRMLGVREIEPVFTAG